MRAFIIGAFAAARSRPLRRNSFSSAIQLEDFHGARKSRRTGTVGPLLRSAPARVRVQE